MELDEIHPFAFLSAVIGIIIGLIMVKRMGSAGGLGIIWKILTPIVAGLGAGLVGQKMAGD